PDRLVQVLGLDEVEAAELLLRLGEGAVGRERLAAADAHRRGRARRLKRAAVLVVAALADPLREGAVPLEAAGLLVGGPAVPALLVLVDQHGVFHFFLLRSFRSVSGATLLSNGRAGNRQPRVGMLSFASLRVGA